MKRKPVFFNETLREINAILLKVLPDAPPAIVIRDIFGRIRVAWDKEAGEIKGYEEKLSKEWLTLGKYGQYEGKRTLSLDDFFEPDSIFKSPDILDYQIPEIGRAHV
jgi:hypothetical protein